MDLFDNFYRWLKEYNPTILVPNIEKEVEVKFVIPFFQKLGYPDGCRRQEFHIKSPQKNKTREFADFVYFSESELTYQNENNSLVLVEAKKFEQNKLETAIAQAIEYGAKIKTPLLVVTNGFELNVIQRKSFEENQVIINSDVEKLKDFQNAKTLYEYLNFSKVQELKQTLSDSILYKQFIQQKNLLATYPEILSQLNQDSFEPRVKREKNTITVTQTKVSIYCELPHLFHEGSCEITFSRPFLHGTSFALDHKAILKSLLVGLNQDFRLGLRGCIQKINSEQRYWAELGSATLLLTEDEATELCSCIDEIFNEYKTIIVSTEDILQTWNYSRIENYEVSGFHIITIPKILWTLMHKFANSFDYGKGNSEWHIFQHNNFAIYVFPRSDIHVILQPYSRQNVFNDHNEIEVIYHPYIMSRFSEQGQEWFNNVGANGIWTITYTKNWLLNQFIPKVVEQYSDQLDIRFPKGAVDIWWEKTFYPTKFKKFKIAWQKTLIQNMVMDAQNYTITPLSEIESPKQLDPYIHDISNFRGSWKISLNLVKPYYSSMLQLIERAQPVPDEVRYMCSKLKGCRCHQHAINNSRDYLYSNQSFDEALKSLVSANME